MSQFITKEQLKKLQKWVKENLPGKPEARIKKTDARRVMDYLSSIECSITKENALAHVRAFRLYPDDTVDMHKVHVDSHKGRRNASPSLAPVKEPDRKEDESAPIPVAPAATAFAGKVHTPIIKHDCNGVRVGIWGEIPSSEVPELIKLTLSL